ncbi:hypothetical protein BDZ97DRAFT_1925030 [Flammula alnicola]|nr:hypothetical protein BDZ97DRAFT_1925030 [Flammula alnicola]
MAGAVRPAVLLTDVSGSRTVAGDNVASPFASGGGNDKRDVQRSKDDGFLRDPALIPSADTLQTSYPPVSHPYCPKYNHNSSETLSGSYLPAMNPNPTQIPNAKPTVCDEVPCDGRMERGTVAKHEILRSRTTERKNVGDNGVKRKKTTENKSFLVVVIVNNTAALPSNTKIALSPIPSASTHSLAPPTANAIVNPNRLIAESAHPLLQNSRAATSCNLVSPSSGKDNDTDYRVAHILTTFRGSSLPPFPTHLPPVHLGRPLPHHLTGYSEPISILFHHRRPPDSTPRNPIAPLMQEHQEARHHDLEHEPWGVEEEDSDGCDDNTWSTSTTVPRELLSAEEHKPGATNTRAGW